MMSEYHAWTHEEALQKYSESGYWREVVLVYDKHGHFRQRVTGPVSEFSS